MSYLALIAALGIIVTFTFIARRERRERRRTRANAYVTPHAPATPQPTNAFVITSPPRSKPAAPPLPAPKPQTPRTPPAQRKGVPPPKFTKLPPRPDAVCRLSGQLQSICPCPDHTRNRS